MTEVGGGNANVTVNDNQVQQTWLGFGGTYNEAGWDALSELSQKDRDRAIRLLFDRRDGAGFTYGRIPIGSSDYGLSRYSLAQLATSGASACSGACPSTPASTPVSTTSPSCRRSTGQETTPGWEARTKTRRPTTGTWCSTPPGAASTNALLTVNRNTNTLNVTPTYYVFRHLAQYVEPGAVRLGTQGGSALAFRNPDGSIVTVVHNAGGQAATTTLAVSGTTLQFQVPGQGWATVNWPGATGGDWAVASRVLQGRATPSGKGDAGPRHAAAPLECGCRVLLRRPSGAMLAFLRGAEATS